MNKKKIAKVQSQALANSRPVRHKWEKTGRRHVQKCKNCGCIKDQTVLSVTRYEVGNQTYFQAPACDTQFNIAMESARLLNYLWNRSVFNDVDGQIWMTANWGVGLWLFKYLPGQNIFRSHAEVKEVINFTNGERLETIPD